MPDVEYKIDYIAPPEKAVRGIDAMEARLLKFEAVVDRVQGKLKGLGADLSGMAKFDRGTQGLVAALKSLEAEANKAERELKGVGEGNSSAGALTRRLKDLEAQLQAVTAAANAAAPAAASVGSGGAKAGGGVGGGPIRRATVLGGIAAAAAMQGLRKISSTMGGSLADRREYFSQAADLAGDYRRNLTELAVLKGKVAPDDELIREDLAFQGKTLLPPDESRTFRLEFGGAISPALKAKDRAGAPNITPETARSLEVEAARFTARYGLDSTTGGRMAGLLGVTQKVPSAAAGVGIMAETMEQLNVEGVGPVKAMAGHLLSLSGGMLEEGGGGRFKSYPEMAARYAASTVNQAGNAARAKTRIVQSDRLLRKFNGKEEEAYLRAAGITPEDDYETAIRKIAPLIKGPNGDNVLLKAGFGNSTERLAVIEEAKMNDTVDQSLADPAKKAKAADAVADNDRYAKSTVARQRSAESAEFAAAIETGLAGERMKAARAAARARMADPSQPGGQRLKAGLFGSITDMAGSTMTTAGAISGEELRVDNEAMKGLIEGGNRVGVDVRALAPTATYKMDSGQQMDDDASRREFDRAYQAVEGAGGDPFGGAPKDAARALRDAAGALDRLDRGGRGGGNRGPMAPSGGANFNPGRR